jgi:DNA-binding transcriptional MerR regulator
MSDEPTYSLEELAESFGLTPRTARHYIESVLPPRHKTGRGRRARYGRDTRNCFAFIRKARQSKLTMAQITALLGQLGQPQIDRVARGLEDLSIVPTAAEETGELYSSPCMAGEFPDETAAAPAPSCDLPRWQILFSDETLQIAHRGAATAGQRQQLRMAAAYIKRILAQER